MLTSNKPITPSSPSKEELKPSTSKVASSNYEITSALLVLKLASNSASYSSLRPRRRSHNSPKNISMCPPLKRESNVSYFTSLSLSASIEASTPEVKHTSTPHLPKILTAPCIESCTEPSAPKKETNMKKVYTFDTIFSSSNKRHSTFHKDLKEKNHHSCSSP